MFAKYRCHDIALNGPHIKLKKLFSSLQQWVFIWNGDNTREEPAHAQCKCITLISNVERLWILIGYFARNRKKMETPEINSVYSLLFDDSHLSSHLKFKLEAFRTGHRQLVHLAIHLFMQDGLGTAALWERPPSRQNNMASGSETEMKPFVTKFHGKAQLTSSEFMATFKKFDKDGECVRAIVLHKSHNNICWLGDSNTENYESVTIVLVLLVFQANSRYNSGRFLPTFAWESNTASTAANVVKNQVRLIRAETLDHYCTLYLYNSLRKRFETTVSKSAVFITITDQSR